MGSEETCSPHKKQLQVKGGALGTDSHELLGV